MAFRIKSLDDPAIAMQIYVHNHGAMVPHLAKIYGNDFQTVFARIGSFIGNGFEISRTNYTELNRDDFECSDDKELYDDAHPGWVKSPDGPKDLEDCIEEYFHRELECLLPWGKKIQILWKFTSFGVLYLGYLSIYPIGKKLNNYTYY